MSERDIVLRLDSLEFCGRHVRDAASAEILRLRAENARLREAVRRWLSWCEDWYAGKPHPVDDLEFGRAALKGTDDADDNAS